MNRELKSTFFYWSVMYGLKEIKILRVLFYVFIVHMHLWVMVWQLSIPCANFWRIWRIAL